MKRPVKRHEVQQPLDSSYRFIPVTKNLNAIVDAADFEWLSQWNWCTTGRAGELYAIRRTSKRAILYMHRIILGCKPGEQGDHKNHNTLDNRRENLRKCTQSQNNYNHRIHKANISGFKGVSWHKETHKWCAQICINGKNKYIGLFASPEKAAHAYDEIAKIHHGEFGFRNFG